LRLCDFAVIFLVYACVDRSADLLVGACWGCLLVGGPDSDASPSIGPYHQAKILFFPTRSLRNRTCIPNYKLSLRMKCGLTRYTLQVRSMTIRPLPLLAATLCPFGCKGAPLPPLPPLPVTDWLTSCGTGGSFLAHIYRFAYRCAQGCRCAPFQQTELLVLPYSPLYGVVSALSPPLLAWYKLYFPLIGVVPVHFRNLCKLTGQVNAVAEVWVHLLPDFVGIGSANGNRHRCSGANPCQMAGGGL